MATIPYCLVTVVSTTGHRPLPAAASPALRQLDQSASDCGTSTPRYVSQKAVMANEPISKDASNPEKAPTKADDGGLVRSTLSSCPASPPISEATIAFQITTCDHNLSLTDDPRMARPTSRANTTAMSALMTANQTWFIDMLASTSPVIAPLKAPTRSMARTLADTRPFRWGIVISCFDMHTACHDSTVVNRRCLLDPDELIGGFRQCMYAGGSPNRLGAVPPWMCPLIPI